MKSGEVPGEMPPGRTSTLRMATRTHFVFTPSLPKRISTDLEGMRWIGELEAATYAHDLCWTAPGAG